MSTIQAIALLTDFGLKDGYGGIMKGAIAAINPHLSVIDITHEIPPQNIAAARFCLMNAYPYFPPGTVYVAVVDPGVGSQRRGVAIQFDRGYLVGPDNGLFSGVLSLSDPIAAVMLTNPDYWRVSDPSSTFHGRDIFAPVGAHLASGVPLDKLGSLIDPKSLVKLSLDSLEITDNQITGSIQYSDHFGNLITNISGNLLKQKDWIVIINHQTIKQGLTYSDVEPGELIMLIGSHGWVEIAVNGGNAQEKLQVDWGEKVRLQSPASLN